MSNLHTLQHVYTQSVTMHVAYFPTSVIYYGRVANTLIQSAERAAVYTCHQIEYSCMYATGQITAVYMPPDRIQLYICHRTENSCIYATEQSTAVYMPPDRVQLYICHRTEYTAVNSTVAWILPINFRCDLHKT